MSQFLQLVQTGAADDVADAIELEPALAEYRDPQGVSALLWAVYAGQAPVRDFLAARLATHGVPLDIFEAAAVGDAARIGAILQTDPDAARAFSGDGWTPLHLAAAFGTPAAVIALLAAGARVDAVSDNPQRNQPLHAALAIGRTAEAIEILLSHGAQVDATQAGGFTPLFSAAAANRRDLAELLIVHGADPWHASDQGKTPAEFARERGYAAMAEWLESQPRRA